MRVTDTRDSTSQTYTEVVKEGEEVRIETQVFEQTGPTRIRYDNTTFTLTRDGAISLINELMAQHNISTTDLTVERTR